MNAGQEAGRLLLRKFEEEKTSLECNVMLPLLVARFRCRVSRLTDNGLFLEAETGTFSFHLPAEVEYEFGDVRELDLTSCFEGTLAIIYHLGESNSETEMLSLTEIVA